MRTMHVRAAAPAMAKVVSLLLAVAALAAGGLALARGNEKIVDYRDVAVRTGSGKAATAEQVCAAVTAAVDGARAEQKYQWAREGSGNGMVAILQVRKKHTLRVDVQCAADRYSVTYKDSSNMNFKQKKNEAVIHPYYNVWVKDLVAAIDAGLAKL